MGYDGFRFGWMVFLRWVTFRASRINQTESITLFISRHEANFKYVVVVELQLKTKSQQNIIKRKDGKVRF